MEDVVQVIQETAGHYLHQGSATTHSAACFERRRLLLELGTARRLTGYSSDQSLVEKAKTEITRVEKQMRRFSRCLLRRRRVIWLEELEEGIRKQDAFTVYRCARLLAGTGIGSKHRRFGHIRAYTPSQIEWAQGLAKEGPKGRSGKRRAKREVLLCTHTRGLTSNERSWSFWTLVKAKRPRIIGKRLEPTTIEHRNNSAVPQLVVRAILSPYQDACGCFSCGRLSCAEKFMTRWDISRPLVHS